MPHCGAASIAGIVRSSVQGHNFQPFPTSSLSAPAVDRVFQTADHSETRESRFTVGSDAELASPLLTQKVVDCHSLGGPWTPSAMGLEPRVR